MKTVGIVGGIGPESTIEYYRFIIEGYRERTTDGSYPSIIINSVDLHRLIGWINAGELAPFTDYLVAGGRATRRCRRRLCGISSEHSAYCFRSNPRAVASAAD
jgi:aspartate racemase